MCICNESFDSLLNSKLNGGGKRTHTPPSLPSPWYAVKIQDPTQTRDDRCIV